MKTYYKTDNKIGNFDINESLEGESIEQKVERIVNNKEPITDGAPIIYTERKQGVQPDYDIRTDRWDVANQAMDYVSRSARAKRMGNLKIEVDNTKSMDGVQSSQGTDN